MEVKLDFPFAFTHEKAASALPRDEKVLIEELLQESEEKGV